MRQYSSPSSSVSQPGSRASDLAGLLSLTLITCAALWVMWEMIPAPRRAMISARLYRSCARAMTALARRTAALSMGRELATGEQRYEAPYWLAVKADSMEQRARRLADV